jgi:hypothetical protein
MTYKDVALNESTLGGGGGGGNLGSFMTCVKYTPPKRVAINFRFHFWCLGFIFSFSQI